MAQLGNVFDILQFNFHAVKGRAAANPIVVQCPGHAWLAATGAARFALVPGAAAAPMAPAAALVPRVLGQPAPRCWGSLDRWGEEGALCDIKAPGATGATGLWSHQCWAGRLEQLEGVVGTDPAASWQSWGCKAVLVPYASRIPWPHAGPVPLLIPLAWDKEQTTKGVGWGCAGTARCHCIPGMAPEGHPIWRLGPGSSRCCRA